MYNWKKKMRRKKVLDKYRAIASYMRCGKSFVGYTFPLQIWKTTKHEVPAALMFCMIVTHCFIFTWIFASANLSLMPWCV